MRDHAGVKMAEEDSATHIGTPTAMGAGKPKASRRF
jgi:hypothetical protein